MYWTGVCQTRALETLKAVLKDVAPGAPLVVLMRDDTPWWIMARAAHDNAFALRGTLVKVSVTRDPDKAGVVFHSKLQRVDPMRIACASELHFEPQLGELTREFDEVEPAGRGLEQDGGREIDLVVDLVVERRAQIDGLAVKSARNEAAVGAIVVRFRAEHERRRQAIRQRARSGKDSLVLPCLTQKLRTVRGVDEIDRAIDAPIAGYDVGDGAEGGAEIGGSLPGVGDGVVFGLDRQRRLRLISGVRWIRV